MRRAVRMAALAAALAAGGFAASAALSAEYRWPVAKGVNDNTLKADARADDAHAAWRDQATAMAQLAM